MKGLGPRARLAFALCGVATAWKAELTFRVQVAAAAAVAMITAILSPGAAWVAMIAITIGAVLAAELLNTALEHALDAMHPEHAAFVRIAKDCAAGAVLVLSAASVVVFVAMLVHVSQA
jgi:diacylglycerol kinase